MRIVKFLFALIVIANSIYLLYLLWSNYLLSDYFWLLQGFNELSYQIYQDPTNLAAIGASVLLLVQTGVIVLSWLVFTVGKWFWYALLPSRSIKLIAKPSVMNYQLYTKYKEAIAIRPVSKAGSILLIRSFFEKMIYECFRQERSKFFNSIGKLKKSGQITKEEAALLYNLRKVGNFTSHQRELSSKEIPNEELDNIFSSIEQLMQHWYNRSEIGLASVDIERRYKPTKPRTRPKSSPSNKTRSDTTLADAEDLTASRGTEIQSSDPSLDTEDKRPG